MSALSLHNPKRQQARGFSLLELTLALTIGSMALVLAGSIFYSVGSVEDSSERTDKVRAESYVLQTVLRDAFLNLLVVHGNAQDSENPPDPAELDRPRIILQDDPVLGNGLQRLEVVLRASPVPSVLQGPAARRAFLDEDAASLNFASADGSGGSARCVFEFRPDGQRESVMASLGIPNPLLDEPKVQTAPGNEQGWSLWWRRMTAAEAEALDAGVEPWGDGLGDPVEESRRLSTAVRLASGLRESYWKIFFRGERRDEYVCYTSGDLPAYVELEYAGLNGEYANWMFEIGWAFGQPEDITIADGAADPNDGSGSTGTGATGNRPGGTNRGNPTDGFQRRQGVIEQ